MNAVLGAPQESFQKALRSLETGCDGWSLPRKWRVPLKLGGTP